MSKDPLFFIKHILENINDIEELSKYLVVGAEYFDSQMKLVCEPLVSTPVE